MSTSTDNREAPVQPRQLLNKYLSSRNISPVRSALVRCGVKRLYKQEGKQIIDATLKEIEPQDHDHLFLSISQSYASSTVHLDSTLTEAIKECYVKADHSSTRRQILPIVADKTLKRASQIYQDIATTSQETTALFTGEVL